MNYYLQNANVFMNMYKKRVLFFSPSDNCILAVQHSMCEAFRDLRRRLKSLVTWFQSEILLQETRQICLRIYRVTSWNCSCQLQITLFWKMIRSVSPGTVFHRKHRRYINTNALIKSEWGEQLTPRKLLRTSGWTCRLFDQERKRVFNQASGPWNSHFFAQFEQLNSISRRTFFKHSTSTGTSVILTRYVRLAWYLVFSKPNERRGRITRHFIFPFPRRLR